MANLSKIVECASQQAFNNIPQKDETILYLTPENTISIQAGDGIEVAKTVDAEGNEIYTVSAAAIPQPITNFATAYDQGFNFNGKTITFTTAEYGNGGYYKINFANGYYIRITAEGGFNMYIYDPYSRQETHVINGYLEAPVSYTFRDGTNDIGENCVVTGFLADYDYGENYTEILASDFTTGITLTFEVED